MSGQLSKPSPLNELCSALPSLPTRLREVGQFVAANDYDATTRSMRDLAAAAGADPASFTRLAKALGYSGWDELRAALTEARRPAQPSPFSGRTRGRRQGPNSDVTLVADKFEAEAAGLARISSGSVAKASKALHVAQRIWIAGFRSCRSVAELLNYQLRLFRPDAVQLVGGSGPEDLDLGAFHAGDAVVAIGFAPYSTASVLSARAAHRSRATLIAVADTAAAPMAEGAEHLLLREASLGADATEHERNRLPRLRSCSVASAPRDASRRAKLASPRPHNISLKEVDCHGRSQQPRAAPKPARNTSEGDRRRRRVAYCRGRSSDSRCFGRRCCFLSRTSASTRYRGDIQAGLEARLCPYQLLLLGAGRGAGRPTRRR